MITRLMDAVTPICTKMEVISMKSMSKMKEAISKKSITEKMSIEI